MSLANCSTSQWAKEKKFFGLVAKKVFEIFELALE